MADDSKGKEACRLLRGEEGIVIRVTEYMKYKATFHVHPRQRLPAPGCPPRHRTPPNPRRAAGRASCQQHAGRLTHRSCLGLSDRQQPSTSRAEQYCCQRRTLFYILDFYPAVDTA